MNWSVPASPVAILEDQEFPKRCGHLAGKRLVETDEMAAKIRAAVAAKRDPDFLLIARTDSRALENFDGAVRRANAYVEAGADAVFPEALQTKEEFRDFAREVKVPLLANMTEFGKSPSLSVAELSELGYRMVIFPQSAFRVAMKTTEEFFRALQRSGRGRRVARPDANAEGTLRNARIRSGGGELAGISKLARASGLRSRCRSASWKLALP
jgi:methylisocitrate lyase